MAVFYNLCYLMRVFILLLCVGIHLADEKSAEDEYFGPRDTFELCEKLCDKDAGYPHSCLEICPDTRNEIKPASNENLLVWIPRMVIGLSFILIAIVLGSYIYVKRLHPYLRRQAEKRAAKKLQPPAPINTCSRRLTYNDEQIVPLNISEVGEEPLSSIIDFGDDVLSAVDSIYNEYAIVIKHADQHQNDNEDSATNYSEKSDFSSFNSSEFSFGVTLPFSSLSSFEDLF